MMRQNLIVKHVGNVFAQRMRFSMTFAVDMEETVTIMVFGHLLLVLIARFFYILVSLNVIGRRIYIYDLNIREVIYVLFRM